MANYIYHVERIQFSLLDEIDSLLGYGSYVVIFRNDRLCMIRFDLTIYKRPLKFSHMRELSPPVTRCFEFDDPRLSGERLANKRQRNYDDRLFYDL